MRYKLTGPAAAISEFQIMLGNVGCEIEMKPTPGGFHFDIPDVDDDTSGVLAKAQDAMLLDLAKLAGVMLEPEP